MNIHLVEKTMHAYHFIDRELGLHTISAADQGGPIVSASTEEEAKRKFERALKLSAAAKNLLTFTGAIKAISTARRRMYVDQMKERIGSIEYHQVAA